MKDLDFLELTKLYLSADRETKSMFEFILKNPEKVAPILEKMRGGGTLSADELKKKLREVME